MKNKILILGLMLVLIPLNAKAATGSVNISCDKTSLAPNETTSCKITGTSATEVSAVSMKLSANISTISDIVADSSWQGDGSNGSIDLYTDTNKKNTFNIATFKIKAPATSGITDTINIKHISFADANFNETSISNTSLKINVVSVTNTLDNVKIKYGDTTKELNLDNLKIKVPSKVNSIELIASSTDQKSSINGTGTKTLKYGLNEFVISVTSEAKDTKKYTVIIEREECRELNSLKINDKKIDLKSGIYEYTLNLDSNVSNVKVEALLSSNEAKVISDLSNIKLNDGLNIIKIVVSDNNNETLTYKLNITKEKNTLVDENHPIKEDNHTEKKEETKVNNPKTGINVVLIFIILAVICIISSMTFIVIRNKKYLN